MLHLKQIHHNAETMTTLGVLHLAAISRYVEGCSHITATKKEIKIEFLWLYDAFNTIFSDRAVSVQVKSEH